MGCLLQMKSALILDGNYYFIGQQYIKIAAHSPKWIMGGFY